MCESNTTLKRLVLECAQIIEASFVSQSENEAKPSTHSLQLLPQRSSHLKLTSAESAETLKKSKSVQNDSFQGSKRQKVLGFDRCTSETDSSDEEGWNPQASGDVINIFRPSGEDPVRLDDKISRHLKAHQLEGIRHMWEQTIGTVAEVREDTKKNKGRGCVIAHSMGLGKTLQAVGFLEVVLRSGSVLRPIIKTAMVVIPKNVANNWFKEFSRWLCCEDRTHHLFEHLHIFPKTKPERLKKLKQWFECGGVMIITHHELAHVFKDAKRLTKDPYTDAAELIFNPGPDILVVDEGHLVVKGGRTETSKALNQVLTRRRVVLTGTPLQNNLDECHALIDFVSPGLLGDIKEFHSRYKEPINAGQYGDSTPAEVKIMKQRIHVLFTTISEVIHRRDHSVISNTLPLKREYVIYVKLTDVQDKIHKVFLDLLERDGRQYNITDWHTLLPVLTNPLSMRWNTKKRDFSKTIETEGVMEVDQNDLNIESNIRPRSSGPSITLGHSSKNSKGSPILESECKDKEDWGDADPLTGHDLAVAIENERQAEHCSGRDAPMSSASQFHVPIGLPSKRAVALTSEMYKTDILREVIEGLDTAEVANLGSKVIVAEKIIALAENSGERVLLFSQSLAVLSVFEKRLAAIRRQDPLLNNRFCKSGRDYVRLDGSVGADQRQNLVDKFNDPDQNFLLMMCSTQACSVGINCTAASKVILFDMSWNPAADVQAMFRVYRYGQTKTVSIYRLVAAGTMEETVIYPLQVKKGAMALRVVDGENTKRVVNQGIRHRQEAATMPPIRDKQDKVAQSDGSSSQLRSDEAPSVTASMSLQQMTSSVENSHKLEMVSEESVMLNFKSLASPSASTDLHNRIDQVLDKEKKKGSISSLQSQTIISDQSSITTKERSNDAECLKSLSHSSCAEDSGSNSILFKELPQEGSQAALSVTPPGGGSQLAIGSEVSSKIEFKTYPEDGEPPDHLLSKLLQSGVGRGWITK